MCAGAGVTALKSIAGGGREPLSISFAFDRPRNSAPYREYFGVPVHFSQEYSVFAVKRSDLAHGVRHEVVREHLERGEAPLSELAVLVGLSDASAVSRGFKVRHGLSPRRWQCRPDK